MHPDLLECRNSYREAAFYGGALPEATVVVIHSAETPELEQSAEGVANYFASGNVQASTHCTTDADSIVQSVPLTQKCWGTGEGGANAYTWQIEQAGYARQSRDEWLDVYSRATVLNTAIVVKEMLARNPKIRPVFLDGDALRAGERYGITSHGEIHRAWPQGDGRTDPGPGYPWDVFFAMVRDVPTDDDLGRLLGLLAELEAEMSKSHLVAAIDGTDLTTVWSVDGAARTKKKVVDTQAIPDLIFHGQVAPPSNGLIVRDPNGVERWPQRVLDHFTTVTN